MRTHLFVVYLLILLSMYFADRAAMKVALTCTICTN
jgi:hypothetical protein